MAPLAATRLGQFTAVGLWLLLVCVGLWFHEYWRDEVRALSIARAASSLYDLLLRLKDEGHPITWYAALRLTAEVLPQTATLPLLSMLAALTAVLILTRRAPLPRHVTVLFLFGGPMIYEYAVMARSYGVGALLTFLSTALLTSETKRPIALAITLGLLANTSAHFFVLALLFAMLAAPHLIRDSPAHTAHLCIGILIIMACFGLAITTMMPTSANLVAQPATLSARAVILACATNALNPLHTFWKLAYPFESLGWPLLACAILGLAARPVVLIATLGAIAGIGALSDLVYVASYRHQGILVVWLMAAYWLVLGQRTVALTPARARMLIFSLTFGLPALLLPMVGHGAVKLWRDIQYPMSASRAAATVIRERYPTAIVLAEPDFLAESLPYYVDNPIFIPRESRFGPTVHFTSKSKSDLTMRELLNTAYGLVREHSRRVVLIFGHALPQRPADGEVTYPYSKRFRWSAEDLAEFSAATIRILQDPGAEIESYSVYAIDAPQLPQRID